MERHAQGAHDIHIHARVAHGTCEGTQDFLLTCGDVSAILLTVIITDNIEYGTESKVPDDLSTPNDRSTPDDSSTQDDSGGVVRNRDASNCR